MSKPYILRSYEKTLKLPFGRQIFSAYAARKAPYFSTIKPLVKTLKPGHCEIFLKKRRTVQNHIGTVHVIAVANGLEMAMGFLAEATIPQHLRWIPKGMELRYPAKADTDLICEAVSDPADWLPGDLPVKVVARRSDGTAVVEGVINLWISEKPKR
ncbi:hotdog fold domain-containing protein [Planktotalea arctica]|uniref:hotdog fold domain-containing protein n=1 Tax=Planktotalea arctica TaxID=1481893 RepID=UPI000A1721A9|nr:hotdog fold domain-containing protein [Planktotalea arctica]